MKNHVNIGGAIINNNDTISAIKDIQEGEGTHVKIIESTIELILSEKDHIQKSADTLMDYLSDLNLIKQLLQQISNTGHNE
ncbi:hypothetical protein [Dysgonomonas macrotermitis]|uniref:Uncharacterized protein n=1 Tax=Dysgonomonas macrotermitis TaxID=1346286 RepID=A0A1M4UJL2_9BACT|nr:hypothetical protein [Dysgonomonas macrotermitis]SHE56889.1 hypothetical protein SAMN05444362_101623 [Dysgonomonas macrotermitis]